MAFYDVVVWIFVALVFAMGYGLGYGHRWWQTTGRRAIS